VAEDKAKGPEGADEDLTEGVGAASNESNEDDGYTSNADEAEDVPPTPEGSGPAGQAEDDDTSDEADTEVPRGEDLADEDLKNPEPFELAEDDEELESTDEDEDDSILSMFEGIPDEEDEEKLAEAEEEAAEMASSRPVRKRTPKDAEAAENEAAPTSATSTAKKNRPTRTRAQATQSDAPKKTGPAQFTGQVVQELKKVSWPTSANLMQYFVVVLIFVVFMIAFIGLLDLLFGWSMLKLFG